MPSRLAPRRAKDPGSGVATGDPSSTITIASMSLAKKTEGDAKFMTLPFSSSLAVMLFCVNGLPLLVLLISHPPATSAIPPMP
jgi:hypothetical protein